MGRAGALARLRRCSPSRAGVATLMIIAVVVAGCGAPQRPTSSTTPTPPQVPTLAAERLDSVLPSVADVNAVMGVSYLQPAAAISHTTFSSAITLSTPDCLGAFLAGQTSVYQGVGYVAASYEYMRGSGPAFVQLTAVGFASADPAVTFVKNSLGKWQACAGQTITQTLNGQTQSWTFGKVVGDVPAITLVRTQEGGNGYACQHTLSAVLNVVLDVSACDTPIGGQAAQLVDKMTATVNQQAH